MPKQGRAITKVGRALKQNPISFFKNYINLRSSSQDPFRRCRYGVKLLRWKSCGDPRRRTCKYHPLSSQKAGRADGGDQPIFASRPLGCNINFANETPTIEIRRNSSTRFRESPKSSFGL
jgi:hypothetical protein